MNKLYKIISHKVNHVIWSLFSTGVILIMLAVLIVSTEFMLRLLIGIIILIVAYMFIYGAYKVNVIKKEIKKYLNF